MKTDIDKCPRCLKAHEDLHVEQFNIPCLGYRYWTSCPETGDPILLNGTIIKMTWPAEGVC